MNTNNSSATLQLQHCTRGQHHSTSCWQIYSNRARPMYLAICTIATGSRSANLWTNIARGCRCIITLRVRTCRKYRIYPLYVLFTVLVATWSITSVYGINHDNNNSTAAAVVAASERQPQHLTWRDSRSTTLRQQAAVHKRKRTKNVW